MKSEIKGKEMRRFFSISKSSINEEARTIDLSFSSTEQYDRGLYIEILSHDDGAVNLDRLLNAAPLLVNHDWSDQVGVVESARIEDGKGRAVVRFGKSTRAQEIFQDVIDGIRKNVSVGYIIDDIELLGKQNGKDIYKVTKWTPLEISIVAVPADYTVGVGRSLEDKIMEVKTMEISINELREQVKREEQQRVAEIMAIGEKFGKKDLAIRMINEGKSVEEMRQALLEELSIKANRPVEIHNEIKFSEREDREYSVLRAINIAAFGGDGFEKDVHQEIAKKLGRDSKGIYVPLSLRALTTSTSDTAKAGYGIETQVGNLIELLRNKMYVRQLGATVLGGLQGNVSFPKQVASSQLSWVAENPGSDLADSDAIFGQVTLSPKSAMATTAYTKQLLAQNSFDVEMFIRNDLATISALGLDYAAIAGSGTNNQPLGILNTTGVGLVVGGTNGALPTYSHIVDLETEVAIDNADIGKLAYLTNVKVRGILKKTPIQAGFPQMIWGNDNLLNGYPAYATNQVPSNLTKGTSTNCSAIIFGNWADLLIGEWGVLEIIADPYSKKKQGIIEITSFLMADIVVRRPESFAVMKDVLTA